MVHILKRMRKLREASSYDSNALLLSDKTNKHHSKYVRFTSADTSANVKSHHFTRTTPDSRRCADTDNDVIAVITDKMWTRRAHTTKRGVEDKHGVQHKNLRRT
jgi:hypothetical protein